MPAPPMPEPPKPRPPVPAPPVPAPPTPASPALDPPPPPALDPPAPIDPPAPPALDPPMPVAPPVFLEPPAPGVPPPPAPPRVPELPPVPLLQSLHLSGGAKQPAPTRPSINATKQTLIRDGSDGEALNIARPHFTTSSTRAQTSTYRVRTLSGGSRAVPAQAQQAPQGFPRKIWYKRRSLFQNRSRRAARRIASSKRDGARSRIPPKINPILDC